LLNSTAATPSGCHQLHQPRRQLDGAHVRGAAEDVVEGQLVELRHDGVAHRAVAVAEVAAPQAADAVDHLVAVHVPDQQPSPRAMMSGAAFFFIAPGWAIGCHRYLRVVLLELVE
jgi:hypothetical protein